MNTDKKLTAKEIEALYEFTRKHFVEYYDLQTELVDHLANGIEAQWQYNQNPDFEDALAVEFKKFGVYGFSDVVDQRKRALRKRYTKLILGYMKEFFTLPKIMLTITAIYLAHLLLSLADAPVFIVVFVLIQLFCFYKLKTRINFLEKK